MNLIVTLPVPEHTPSSWPAVHPGKKSTEGHDIRREMNKVK